jgi:hypothetical protein
VYLVLKLSASSRFAYTFIRFNLINLEVKKKKKKKPVFMVVVEESFS